MKLTRRDFVKQGTVAATATILSGTGVLRGARAASLDDKPLRVGLVGCGGRGTGAAEDCLRSAPNMHLVALADIFPDRLASCRQSLSGLDVAGVEVDDAHCFTGFDAYQKLIGSDLDLVLLATPPGFRPLHFRACIDAGKHVFMEKPVAVDPSGVRKIIATGQLAESKGLAVVTGTKYRRERTHVETIRRIQDGQIGDIVAARAYYDTGGLWRHDRKPGESDMEWQIRNWYYFDWLSGDHIVEQHVHTLDLVNWTLGSHPLRAVGLGGRQIRTDPVYGNIYDHFAIDYEYPGGVHMMSFCRQMPGTDMHVGAYFVGTKGEGAPYTGAIAGAKAWKFEGDVPNPYVLEHTDLVQSIRSGKPLNESRQIAESTLTAILGREAAYTGKAVSWDDMMESKTDLSPARYEWGPLAIRPVPMPGSSAG